MGFVDWIRAVIEARRRTYARPTSGGRIGIAGKPCLRDDNAGRGGAARLESRPAAARNAPPDRFPGSLIAPTLDRVQTAVDTIEPHRSFPWEEYGCQPGLSLHAPYSVLPELIDLAASTCAALDWPVAMHLAESREELEWLRSGTGPFFEFLSTLPGWTGGMQRPGARPMDYLRKLQLMNPALVIHGNYLNDEEIRFLADHRRTICVVYCPRTHACFGHDRYPLEKMLAAGAGVALGTDSRASSPNLSILAEMRFLAAEHPIVPPAAVLRLATLAGARPWGARLDRQPGAGQGRRSCGRLPSQPGQQRPLRDALRFGLAGRIHLAPRRALPVKPNAERRSHSIHLACGRGS